MYPNIKCPNHGNKHLEKSNTKKWIYHKCKKCSYLVILENKEDQSNEDF